MGKKLDVKKLKNKLALSDYKKILEALEMPVYLQGDGYTIYYSAERYKDYLQHKPKTYFYEDNKIFMNYTGSYSCDIIGLVQKRLTVLNKPSSFIDAVKFIMEVVGLESSDISRIHNSQHRYNWQNDLEKYVRFRKNGAILPEYNKAILEQLDPCYPQSWIDEGISIDSMEKYHIGYYARKDATTIPCFGTDGQLVGIRVRNWNPEQLAIGRKYVPLTLLDNTQYNFPTNATFYGINYNKPEVERSGHVILVEGEKSVLKADTFWGNKSNVLALYGSQLGMTRRNALIKMGVNHVTLALDSDFHELGDEEYLKFEKKIINMGKMFKGFADVDVVFNNIGLDNAYKASPFDFDEETFNRLYKNREIIE